MRYRLVRATLLLMLCVAQIPAHAVQTTISGEVDASDNQVIIMYWNDFSLIQDTLSPDKNGRFTKNYSFSDPMYIRIIADATTPFMLVFPGENLHTQMKNSNIQLSGTAAPYNSFFIALLNKTDSLVRVSDQNAATGYALEQCDSFFKSFRHTQANAIEKLTVQFFVFRYKFYPTLVKYSSDADKMNTLKSIVKGGSLPGEDEDIWKYFDRVKYDDEANKYDFQYLNMMNNLVRILRFQAVNNDSTLAATDAYLIETNTIKDVFPSSAFRTSLLAYNLYFRIASYTQFPAQLGSVDDFIHDFKNETNVKASYIPALLKKYAEAKASFGSLKKGAKAPDFKLKDVNGRTVSLSDYRGKVVYLDIWASWCGPCLKEMPYINELKEKYKNRGLEVISISVDTKPEAWQKKITDLQLTGVQLIDEAGIEKSKLVKDYFISGVPHFVLIDKTGKIVLASAPRPSEANLLETAINKLLK